MYSIGLDVHKKTISYCVKDAAGHVHREGKVGSNRRRILRYRSLAIKQMVRMKNRASGLPMETGVDYNKRRLHKAGYCFELSPIKNEGSGSIRQRRPRHSASSFR
jgi:hypothetical protein